MSILTGISYDRINRAVRFGIVGVFSADEREALIKASNDLLNEHAKTHSIFKSMLSE